MVGISAAVGLLLAYGRGDAQQRNQLDAIRTAGTIVVGSGGAAALLLAARRQRSTEIALKQKDRDQVDIARAYALQKRVAEDARQDVVERRITELYTKAADQLGSDKAPVRLAGLDALERLAQDNESQRQTIVNVLCAYLRMPYDARLTAVPSSSGDVGAEGAPGREEIREHSQERQARLTARRILADHLRPARDHPAVTFWGDTDLDLTGATIIGFEMIDCHVRAARFGVARFAGGAVLGANFTERAVFDGAWMRGPGSFPACWTLSTTRGVRWPDAEGEWRLLVRKPVAPGPEPDGTAAAEPVQS